MSAPPLANKLLGFDPLHSYVARWGKHPDSVLLHLVGGHRVVQLSPVWMGRLRPRALRTVLHHRLEGLPHLGQGRLLRHLLLRLLHPGSRRAHCGVAVSDHLQGVALLLPAVRQRHPEQPAVHRETTLHGERCWKSHEL